MKIIVRPTQRKGFTLRFPTCLVLNPITAFLLARLIRRKSGRKVIPAKYLRRLFRAVKQERKRLGSAWELVSIHSQEGHCISILP